MSREKSIKTINIHLEKLTALELEEVTILTNALLAVRNVREEHQNTIASNKALEKSNLVLSEENAKFVVENIELQKQIAELKSQIEKQQPDIPEFVANYIEAAKEDFWTLLSAMDDPNLSSRVGDWLKGGSFNNQEIFAQAWINGYTVAKQKRFYLKNKLTSLYLTLNTGENEYYEHHHDCALKNQEGWKYKFTQQEIDSMETGSYEQIEVQE